MALNTIEDVLFPEADVELERVTAGLDLVLVEAAACGPAVRCPDCGIRGRRVHSTYWRTVAERPLVDGSC
ncbi:hypothetical protein ACIF6L_38040 [Kitasatospora sp. NPDC086009]|uniref:hypothetical protein n=1 Tax=unclassified Kitasatospora TaxID=2633591 RepID=UPI0037C5496C